MSNPESFIDEVTEEVRRERLFKVMRKYGWIAGLVVAGIVGGAAWNEWQKAEHRDAARAFGDAVHAAFDAPDVAARVSALEAVKPTLGGDQEAIRDLLLASDPEQSRDVALSALSRIIANTKINDYYRDMASLRRVMVVGSDESVSQRSAALDPLTAPGRPFRTLALEQKAYLALEDGKTDVAITQLQALVSDAEAPAALRQRVSQLLGALGVQSSTADEVNAG